jgi:hypothetical protein
MWGRDVNGRIEAMTDRTDKPVVGGGDPKPSDDLTFDAHDARLNRELDRFGRMRAGCKGEEFPHDESYTPGYHQGGTRFGFFNSGANVKPPAAMPPPAKDDKAGGKG